MEVAMSITRSYNKHTDTYYAYDTTYEWDEKAQKKVQRKKCIGKYDPLTGEIIPTGKRGRPLKQALPQDVRNERNDDVPRLDDILSKANDLSARIDAIDVLLAKASEDLRQLRSFTDELIRQIRSED